MLAPKILAVCLQAVAVSISGGGVKVPCTVPCYWPRTPSRGAVYNVSIDGAGIVVTMSMESESYYPELSLRHRTPNHWVASTRFDSDVPMPYFSFAEYNIQRRPLGFHSTIKAALFVARNCNSKSNREALVRNLMKHMPVVSPSSCMNNARWDKGDKALLMRTHALYLAFENSIVPDYITEKLWGAYAAGTIPVYYGAPNIREHIPPGSAVIASDFPDARALARHLLSILSSRSLYRRYHSWRYRPLPGSFTTKYNLTRTHSACRLCQQAVPRVLPPFLKLTK